MGGVIGCKISNFLTAAWLLQCCKKNRHFILDQQDTAAVDDEGRAHCIAGQILGVLKEGNRFNCQCFPQHTRIRVGHPV